MSERIIELLNQSQTQNAKLAFVTAGGGVGLYKLFRIPGAGNVMTEARMLYSKESFETFLEESMSGSFVSQNTADRLAVRLDSLSEADYCFAFTCALTTTRERKGQNRGYLSLCHKQQINLQYLISVEGNNRREQDDWVTNSILEQVINYFQRNR